MIFDLLVFADPFVPIPAYARNTGEYGRLKSLLSCARKLYNINCNNTLKLSL
jgi:hypothetical protein